MSAESDVTLEVAPDVVPVTEAVEAETTEGQEEAQAAEPKGEEKSKSAQRHEREKAYKERLRQQAAEAQAEAERADSRRLKIIEAGKSEKPPVEGDFTDYTDFVAAKAVWTAEQRTNQRHAHELEEEAAEARQKLAAVEEAERQLSVQIWTDRVAEAKSRYADFDAVVYAPDVPISAELSRMIQQSDKGADIAYWLGMNKAAAAELSALSKTSPVQAAWNLGRIEATMTAAAPRTITQAPPPVAPVRGNVQPSLNPEKMGMAEYIAARKAGKL